MSTRPKRPRVAVNAAAADGNALSAAANPTLTHYRELANRFTTALEEIAAILPELQPPDPESAVFVRSHQSVPEPFILTATDGVAKNPELQGIATLDPDTAFDSMQFVEAFYPVSLTLAGFTGELDYTVRARKALLGRDALDVYYHAKRIATDPEKIHLLPLVENLRRTLGRNVPRPRKAEKGKEGETTSAGTPAKQTE